MEAEKQAAAVQAQRAHLIEQRQIWDEKIKANAAPRTWQTYLPAHHQGKASADALTHFRRILDRPLPEGVPRSLTNTQIAEIDASFNLEPEAPPSPKRKKAKVVVPESKFAKGSINDLAEKAKAKWDGMGVSPHGKRALDRVWGLEFGADIGNPFRTRLTRAMCVTLGAGDYYSIIKDVCDLMLCKERVATGAYEDDAALRRDVRRIAENALQYHGPHSPYTSAADQMAAAFDAALAGA